MRKLQAQPGGRHDHNNVLYKRYKAMQYTVVNITPRSPSKDSTLHEIIFHPRLETKYLRCGGYELRPRLAGSCKNRLHKVCCTDALPVSFVGARNADRVVSHGSTSYKNLYLDSHTNGSNKWFYFRENCFSRESDFEAFLLKSGSLPNGPYISCHDPIFIIISKEKRTNKFSVPSVFLFFSANERVCVWTT